MISVADPYSCDLGFLDQSLLFLSSSSSIVLISVSGPSVPDPLVFRKFGSAMNRTRTYGSVARNSDH
jgi:hypothetical protein